MAAFALGKPPPLLSIRATPKVMSTPERRRRGDTLFYENPVLAQAYTDPAAIRTKRVTLRQHNPAEELLKELNEHPNVDLFLVPLIRQEVIGTNIHQTFPLVGHDLLNLPEGVYQANRDTIIKTLNQAIDFLHGQNILHRDIKPENIVWDPEAHRATLIDFQSLVRVHGEEIIEPNTFRGTIGHRNRVTKEVKHSKDRDRYNAEVTIHALDTIYVGVQAPAGFSEDIQQFVDAAAAAAAARAAEGGMRTRATRKHRSHKKNGRPCDRLRASQSRRRNRSRTLARQL